MLQDLILTLGRTILSVGLVIVLVRLVGLRSFSKMAGFDFVTTVAIGSLLATSIVRTGTDYVICLAGLAALFGVVWLVSWLRRHSTAFHGLIDNTPILLMRDGRILEANMARAAILHDDLFAKLRNANVTDLAKVRAVVLETTGDVTVLQGDADGPDLDRLLSGVRR